MPKVIENIEGRVFRGVSRLITEQGYASISMRMIAEETGIAVGTLYNYYSDKEDLTTSVVYQSWLETLKQLDAVLSAPEQGDDKVRGFIRILYHEMKMRRGIGNELMKHNLFKKEKFLEVKSQLNRKFKVLFAAKGKEVGRMYTDGYLDRVINTVMLTIVNSINEFQDQDESNLTYLNEMIGKLI